MTRQMPLFATALAALLAAAPLAAQAPAADSGTFRVSVGGREVGTESFSIQQTGAGAGAVLIASGRVSLRLASGSLELSPRLRATGFQADPVHYEVIVGGDSPRRIAGNIGGGRVSARIVTSAGEQLREYVASSGAVVLDDGVAHHYYFLAQRLHSGRVPVIVPSENRQVIATVVDRGEEVVQVGGRSARLFHLVVRPQGGDEQHVWVDALNRVIKVEIPARGYQAVRTALPQ
ncbi:MAG TPA: hypothetical protein VEW03_13530 [Longimicrobiaceae bacterium]|nr:hypothetical protein [Longimicrobiaceae bacterium]